MSVASRLSMRRVSDSRCGGLGRLTMGAFYAKALWRLAGDTGEPKRDADTMSRATAWPRTRSKFAGLQARRASHEDAAFETTSPRDCAYPRRRMHAGRTGGACERARHGIDIRELRGSQPRHIEGRREALSSHQ